MTLSQSLLSYSSFGKLRLSDFVVASKITYLEDWEYLNELWVGEAVGFSEWLRLQSSPDVLGSLALDFPNLDSVAVSKVMAMLGLPLRQGMSIEEISQIIGNPSKTKTFVADRKSYEFILGSQESYTMSCTVKNVGGLIYLTLVSHQAVPS